MKNYDHKKIEGKWQKEWVKKGIFQAKDKNKDNFSLLTEFPYPSGNLHVGHWYAFAIPDIFARAQRMKGKNVMYPIGFDAFGLPAENAAIKRGLNPKKWTYGNIAYMKKQLSTMGASFDWKREVITADPEYYKWTQFFFTRFYKKGLAYEKESPVNWCPSCKTVLANEQVSGGACERCGSEVERRLMKQWNIKITEYADRLLSGLENLPWPEEIKQAQRNWIGRSEGALLKFKMRDARWKTREIEAFTTRPDTLFGVTYIVLAPETAMKLMTEDAALKAAIKNREEVEAYISSVKNKSEIERTDTKKEKTGIELKGVGVINPVNGEEVPVWVADYVLPDYGTGAVMAVPAHDDRDFEFATKFKLPIREVVIERMVDKKNPHVPGKEVVFRDAIIAVVRDPKTDKYLCLKWKKQPWTTFVMGGIENGEDPVVAALREIEEETGYKNVKHVKTLRRAQSEFFAAHKGVNRVAHTRNILFELENDERKDIAAEESDIHEIVWMSLDEILKTNMTHSEMPIILDGIRGTDKAFTDEGVLINSGKFSKRSSEKAKKDITKFVGGEWITKYKLRDWVVSRQRYWGVPIPIIHCAKCGSVPVPDKDLPVKLPEIEDYLPRDDGKSPLAKAEKWMNTKCPKCKGPAERETDTLDTFVDSSWYYLRYSDPKNKKSFASKANMKRWMPINFYSGGAEHTTMHLLYSRFFYKALHDLGLVPLDEPYERRMNRGLILGPDGNKMSKSKGNVIDPDDIVVRLGADTMRLYLAFIGPYNETGSYPWNIQSIAGVRRFLERVWRLQFIVDETKDAVLPPIVLHHMLKKANDSIERFSFNTGVPAMMVFVNEAEKAGRISRGEYEAFLKILSVFAPHISEELWHMLGNKTLISCEKWPVADENVLKEASVEIAIQVNGKARGVISLSPDSDEAAAKALALALPEVAKWVSGKEIAKVIYVRNRIINIVVKG